MGMMEKFEASLQALRGTHIDITQEAQEIQVLNHMYVHLFWFKLQNHEKFLGRNFPPQACKPMLTCVRLCWSC